MRAIETIKNIWKIEDLRKRIITTILLVLVYRVGSYVVLPGIDPANLDALRSQFRPMAERQVKTRLALEKVVKLEKIHAGKKEIAKEYEDIANAYHMDVEQVKQLADEKSV